MRALIHRLLAGIIALGVALPSTAVPAQTLSPGHQLRCPKLEWPVEALRKEMTGTVTLEFQVTDSGTADVVVIRSSGWKVLDDATARAIRRCTREAGAAAVEGPQRLTYSWSLDAGYGGEVNRLLQPKPPGGPASGPYVQ